MKVVVYDNYNIVSQIFNEVYDPKVDRDRHVIVHSNGKIFGVVNNDRKNFMIVEDHVPIELGTILNDDLKDYDQSHKYDNDFSMEDVKEVIEEGIEKIKDVVTSEDDKDKDRHD